MGPNFFLDAPKAPPAKLTDLCGPSIGYRLAASRCPPCVITRGQQHLTHLRHSASSSSHSHANGQGVLYGAAGPQAFLILAGMAAEGG